MAVAPERELTGMIARPIFRRRQYGTQQTPPLHLYKYDIKKTKLVSISGSTCYNFRKRNEAGMLLKNKEGLKSPTKLVSHGFSVGYKPIAEAKLNQTRSQPCPTGHNSTPSGRHHSMKDEATATAIIRRRDFLKGARTLCPAVLEGQRRRS
jgi:hypothetical protein